MMQDLLLATLGPFNGSTSLAPPTQLTFCCSSRLEGLIHFVISLGGLGTY